MSEEQINFEQLIELLDRALVSKDPKVMRALKKFLFIAALATEDTEEEGPFKNLIRRVEDLEARINAPFPNTYTYPYDRNTWVGVGTGPTYGGGTSTSSGSTFYHQYIPATTTSGDSFDFDGFTQSFPTVTCKNFTETSNAIDNELGDLEQMAQDMLAKSK